MKRGWPPRSTSTRPTGTWSRRSRSTTTSPRNRRGTEAPAVSDAQEAFANIRKHSKATSVEITLEQEERVFLVRMVDDGVGFDPGRSGWRMKEGHIGLSSMRERAEMAGGGCRIRSLPGEGTTVEFWVPSSLQTVGVSERRSVAHGG